LPPCAQTLETNASPARTVITTNLLTIVFMCSPFAGSHRHLADFRSFRQRERL
jgi:hypothetical protein